MIPLFLFIISLSPSLGACLFYVEQWPDQIGFLLFKLDDPLFFYFISYVSLKGFSFLFFILFDGF